MRALALPAFLAAMGVEIPADQQARKDACGTPPQLEKNCLPEVMRSGCSFIQPWGCHAYTPALLAASC